MSSTTSFGNVSINFRPFVEALAPLSIAASTPPVDPLGLARRSSVPLAFWLTRPCTATVVAALASAAYNPRVTCLVDVTRAAARASADRARQDDIRRSHAVKAWNSPLFNLQLLRVRRSGVRSTPGR